MLDRQAQRFGFTGATGLFSEVESPARAPAQFASPGRPPSQRRWRFPLRLSYSRCSFLGQHEEQGGLVMVKAHGAVITDIEGKDYIDGIGAPWLANIGYGRPEMAAAAQKQGTWFGIEHWGVVPDLISCAKGITSGYFPVGATLLHDRVYEALRGDGTAYFNHGFTYSGHPVGAVGALENLRIIDDEELLARSAELGAYLAEQLRALQNPWIGDVRGKGLMLGVELVQDRKSKAPPIDPDAAKKVELACRTEGVLLRALGGAVIAISPPLVITYEQIDRIVAILDRSIRAGAGE